MGGTEICLQVFLNILVWYMYVTKFQQRLIRQTFGVLRYWAWNMQHIRNETDRKGEGSFWSFLKLEILLNFKRLYILLIGLIHMFLNWNLSTLSLTIYFNRKHYMKVLALPTDKAQSSHFFLKITFLDGVNVKVTNIFNYFY